MKTQLIIQFITEALILTGMAALISLIAYQVLRPVFNQVLNTTFESVLHLSTGTILYLIALVFLTGFIAGRRPHAARLGL